MSLSQLCQQKWENICVSGSRNTSYIVVGTRRKNFYIGAVEAGIHYTGISGSRILLRNTNFCKLKIQYK